MIERVTKHPNSVIVEERAYRGVSGIAIQLGMNPKHTLGMAIEFAYQNQEDFIEYCEENQETMEIEE